MITAYQEGLLTLPQLRHRIPELRKQLQAIESELQSLELDEADQSKYLQLADSLGTFRRKLRLRAAMLDIQVRQQILRLLVKEVLVGTNTITIRHSIPVPASGPGSSDPPQPPCGASGALPASGYLLRKGNHFTVAQ